MMELAPRNFEELTEGNGCWASSILRLGITMPHCQAGSPTRLRHGRAQCLLLLVAHKVLGKHGWQYAHGTLIVVTSRPWNSHSRQQASQGLGSRIQVPGTHHNPSLSFPRRRSCLHSWCRGSGRLSTGTTATGEGRVTSGQ